MSHFHAERWRLDRRHLLRGAGAAFALPFLDCMQLRAARADERPKRSVFLYVPNGVNTLDWQIHTAGPGYRLTAPLQPLEEHREHITPISGLHHPNGLGEAHKVDRIWLTAAKLDQEGTFRNTVSADQLMAEVAGVHTRFPSLEIALTGRTLAWSREGVPLPAERKSGVIFDRLFGVQPGGLAAARRRLERRSSVLDVVLEDARRLRHKIGGEDRSKLDEYLSAVREVELRTERADAWLDVPRPKVAPDLAEHLTRNIPDRDAGDYYSTIYDLVALALRTDMTRVVTCMLGNESHAFALPEIGVQQTRHELSHHNGAPEAMARLTQTDTFLCGRLASFLSALRAHDEQGESLLDRTMVLYGSGMAYGHSHGNANLPTILAGGRALGLKHGRHLDFNLPHIGAYDLEDTSAYYSLCVRPADGDARLCNLLLTMLHRMDVDMDSFGDSLRPLSELG
jgi:hypothetical protein